VTIGLVEAEDERPLDPVCALDREQLVPVADHPIDVLAEVDVGVEDGDARGQLGTREVGVSLEDAVRPLDRVHGLSVWT
jgi:hypothetical protein